MGVIYDHRQSGGQHKLIFCVEDDEAAGNLAAYALESAGFHVQIFPNGQAFFKALESAEPELILLDIMLPGEDGLSILKKLRADSSTSEIPVILTTAKGTGSGGRRLSGKTVRDARNGFQSESGPSQSICS